MTLAISGKSPTGVVARSHLQGNRIALRWTNPPASGFGDAAPQAGVRIVRRERTFPLGPDDGVIVYSGPVVDRFTDTGLTPHIRYYYTVFAFDGSDFHTGEGAQDSALATASYGLAERLYRMLPAVHQRDDTPLRTDEVLALPPDVQESLRTLPPDLNGTGQLRRFLAALGAPMGLMRSTAEALRQLHDVDRVPPEYLPMLAGFLDWRTDHTLPVHSRRNEVRAAPQLYRTVGTVPNLRAIVTRYTGWETKVAEYAQHIARSNHAPQQNVFLWRAGLEPGLVTLDGAPRGRLAVAQHEPDEIRLVYAVADPLEPVQGRAARRAATGVVEDPFLPSVPVSRLRTKAFRGGSWSDSVDLFPDAAVAAGEPAVVALPRATRDEPKRVLVAWVDAPGTAEGRLRYAVGTLGTPAPAELLGERSSPLPVQHRSWLVVTANEVTKGMQFAQADFADPAAPQAAEVATVINQRLAGHVVASVVTGGRLRLASTNSGGDARLAIDPRMSTAAEALGFARAGKSATGDWGDEVTFAPPADIGPAGRVAELSATVRGTEVVLAYAQHDGTAWQVRVISWNGTAWSGDEPLTVGGVSCREPAVATDAAGRIWAVWARQAGPSQDRWSLLRRTRDPATGVWDSDTPVTQVPPPADPDATPPVFERVGDREPALRITSAGPTVYFRSDRAGGHDLWELPIGGSAVAVTSSAAAETWPMPVDLDGEAAVLYRSDQPVAHSLIGSGPATDTGTLRHYAGTTSAKRSDLDRLRRLHRWDDLMSYTPCRPDGETAATPLRDNELYTRGAVGLYLTQLVSGPLDADMAERLRAVLRRFVPLNVRVIIWLAPRADVEVVYRPGADLTDTFADRHPEIDYVGPSGEQVAVILPGWAQLTAARPATPPPADPRSGGVTADPVNPTSMRRRTYAPPPQ